MKIEMLFLVKKVLVLLIKEQDESKIRRLYTAG